VAKLRRLGNIAEMFLRTHLADRANEQESERVKQRQLEVAGYNRDAIAQQAEQDRIKEFLSAGLKDPKQFELMDRAGMMMGDIAPKSFRPADEKILAQLGAGYATAKEDELPTDLGIENQLRTQWGGEEMAKNPNNLLPLMNARDSRQASLEGLATTQAERKGEESRLTAYGTATGNEQADAENFPAKLERDLEAYRQQSPLEAQRAGMTAGASAAAQQPYQIQMERLRQADRLEMEKVKRADERAKLPPGLAERVAGADSSLDVLDELELLFNTKDVSSMVGPAEGRARALAQAVPILPTDPSFNTFLANEATLTNSMIKSITGAQMSEPEAKRIMRQIPSHKDKPEVWAAKARATRENSIMLRNKIIEMSGSTLPLTEMPAEQAPPAPNPRLEAARAKLRAR